MNKKFVAVKGMPDILPDSIHEWHLLEELLKNIAQSFCYREIRTPILEKSHLFKRSIGDITDIVHKEMYSFVDRNGEGLSLRPEGTAACVRACIEHNLLYGKSQRLWYLGPMYRYERPQKGRYRQFYHFGLEALGLSSANVNIELLMFCIIVWRKLNILTDLTLEINSLGDLDTRNRYKTDLVKFLEKNVDSLDDDCRQRLHNNPLRILDSKNIQVQQLLTEAPNLNTYLSADAKDNLYSICKFLQQNGVKFNINPRLVRGLDYYSDIVFEWTHADLGSQSTVCAGGEYKDLLKQLGDKQNISAAGLSIGIERLLIILRSKNYFANIHNDVDLYFMYYGDAKIQNEATQLLMNIREKFPNIKLMWHANNSNLKQQFKQANKVCANLALIFAEDELNGNFVTIKFLQDSTKEQIQVDRNNLDNFLSTQFK